MMLYYFNYNKINPVKFVKNKYKKIKNLTKLVSSVEKNNLLILYGVLKLIFFNYYILLTQYLNKNVKQINSKTYELSYVINNKLYKNIITIKRGPQPILQIINDENIDVTEQVLPYLGPCYDWHKNDITPKILGYKNLTFIVNDEQKYNYQTDNIIKSF